MTLPRHALVASFLLASGLGPLRAQTAETNAPALIEALPRPPRTNAEARTATTGAPELATSVRVPAETIAGARPGARLRLEVSPGVSAVAEVSTVRSTLLGRRVVAGSIVGRPSGRFLLVNDPVSGESAATIALSAEEHYVLGRAPGGSGGLQVRRAPARPLPAGPAVNDAVTPPAPLLAAPRPRALPADAGPADAPGQYDLLIVYTAAARAAAGSTAAIELTCELAAENCNECYASSGIALRARLVHTMESAYVETGSYSADLDKVASGTLVNAGDVAAARDQYGADFVSFFVGNESTAQDSAIAGLGYLNAYPNPGEAFSICNQQFAADLTLVHEIGHNMGCAHDAANAAGFGTPAYPFSYGWRWTGSDGVLYRDVMAYAPGVQEPLFSSPQVTFAGGVAGDATQADNARTIRENAPAYCNYRRSTVGLRPRVSIATAGREAYKATGQPARIIVVRAGTDLGQPLEVRLAAVAADVLRASGFSSPYLSALRAVAGADFAALSPTVIIPAGAASVEMALSPLPHDPAQRLDQTPKAAFVALLPGNGYEVGTPLVGTVLIYEQPQGVALSAPQPLATQNPPQPARLVASRTGVATDPAAANVPLNLFVFADGDAREGVDYTISPSPRSPAPVIAAGAESLVFTITALAGANLPPAGKTLSWSIGSVSGRGGYHFDPDERVSITLLPNAPAAPAAVVSVTAGATRVVEGGGALKLYFARTGGDPNADLTVAYKVGGAGSGRLAPLSGAVVIPAGATRAKVKLRASDDGVAEGDQGVKVTVVAGEGYTVGSPAKVKIVVGDSFP